MYQHDLAGTLVPPFHHVDVAAGARCRAAWVVEGRGRAGALVPSTSKGLMPPAQSIAIKQ